jgi:hypothetical protein
MNHHNSFFSSLFKKLVASGSAGLCEWIPVSQGDLRWVLTDEDDGIEFVRSPDLLVDFGTMRSTTRGLLPHESWDEAQNGPRANVVVVSAHRKASNLATVSVETHFALVFTGHAPAARCVFVPRSPRAAAALPAFKIIKDENGYDVRLSRPCELTPADYARRLVHFVAFGLARVYNEVVGRRGGVVPALPVGHPGDPATVMKHVMAHLPLVCRALGVPDSSHGRIAELARVIKDLKNQCAHDSLTESWLSKLGGTSALERWFDSASELLLCLEPAIEGAKPMRDNVSTLHRQLQSHLFSGRDDAAALARHGEFKLSDGRTVTVRDPHLLNNDDYLRRTLLHTGRALTLLAPHVRSSEPLLGGLPGKPPDAYTALKHFKRHLNPYLEAMGFTCSTRTQLASRKAMHDMAERLMDQRNAQSHPPLDFAGSSVPLQVVTDDQLCRAMDTAAELTFFIKEIVPAAWFCSHNLNSLVKQFKEVHLPYRESVE